MSLREFFAFILNSLASFFGTLVKWFNSLSDTEFYLLCFWIFFIICFRGFLVNFLIAQESVSWYSGYFFVWLRDRNDADRMFEEEARNPNSRYIYGLTGYQWYSSFNVISVVWGVLVLFYSSVYWCCAWDSLGDAASVEAVYCLILDDSSLVESVVEKSLQVLVLLIVVGWGRYLAWRSGYWNYRNLSSLVFINVENFFGLAFNGSFWIGLLHTISSLITSESAYSGVGPFLREHIGVILSVIWDSYFSVLFCCGLFAVAFGLYHRWWFKIVDNQGLDKTFDKTFYVLCRFIWLVILVALLVSVVSVDSGVTVIPNSVGFFGYLSLIFCLWLRWSVDLMNVACIITFLLWLTVWFTWRVLVFVVEGSRKYLFIRWFLFFGFVGWGAWWYFFL